MCTDALDEFGKTVPTYTGDEQAMRAQRGHIVALRNRLLSSLARRMHDDVGLSSRRGARIDADALTARLMRAAHPFTLRMCQQRLCALTALQRPHASITAHTLLAPRALLEHAASVACDAHVHAAGVHAAYRDIRDRVSALVQVLRSASHSTLATKCTPFVVYYMHAHVHRCASGKSRTHAFITLCAIDEHGYRPVTHCARTAG
jgi:hypothetical protein